MRMEGAESVCIVASISAERALDLAVVPRF